MLKAKITIDLNPTLLARLDGLVTEEKFPSRSLAVESAIEEKLERLEQTRLAGECAKIDSAFEKAMSSEGLEDDLAAWPAN